MVSIGSSEGPMKLETRYKPSPFLSWRELDGQTVAVDPQEGKAYHFNGVGAAIWQFIDGHQSVAKIIECLAAQYESPEKKIQKDVISFLKELSQNDLITPASPE